MWRANACDQVLMTHASVNSSFTATRGDFMGYYKLTRGILAGAALAAALLAAGAVSADGIPGMRGHDHTGITVPDMKAAEGVLHRRGRVARRPCRSGRSRTTRARSCRTRSTSIRARSSTRSRMVRCGCGSNIELFQYKSPDQKISCRKTAISAAITSRSMSTTSRGDGLSRNRRTSRPGRPVPGQ